jgi:crotonobetainyl-CoA:carnitine CoA-transferase CaiB-like acyl-CoA transferase
MATEATGPLKGMKVVEVAQVVAGPTCGYMLADLGADVIKVERIPSGDDNRRMVPPAIAGEAAAFLMLNRNKRGIALDLKTPAGCEVFFRLTDRADVLIENFRKGVMDRLGVGYEALKRRNPGLVYCAISGFGQTGPYAERGGYDLVAQAMSGLMSITGEGPGRPPVKVGSPLADFGAGVLAALGVAAAYAHKLKTGEGQVVDTSLYEAGISATFHQTAMYLATGVSPGPLGSAHPLSAPYQAYPTKDGWITVGAGNQSNWPRLCAALGAPELVEDPRFKLNAGRLANLAELNAALEPLFRRFTTAQLMAKLEDAGVPAGPVNTIGQMAEDPQTKAREMIVEVPHAKAGKVKTLGSPIKLGATPTNLRRGAPLFGEHTREVLAEHGYREREIEKLIADKVVIAA